MAYWFYHSNAQILIFPTLHLLPTPSTCFPPKISLNYNSKPDLLLVFLLPLSKPLLCKPLVFQAVSFSDPIFLLTWFPLFKIISICSDLQFIQYGNTRMRILPFAKKLQRKLSCIVTHKRGTAFVERWSYLH